MATKPPEPVDSVSAASDIAFARAEKEIAAYLVEQGYEISPTILLAIVTAILQMLGVCSRTPGQISALLQNPNALTRAIVTAGVMNSMREQFGPLAFFTHNGKAIVAAVLKVGKSASVAELAAMKAVKIS